MAKSAHGSNQPLFQLRHTSLPNIKHFPRWNNILVEKNLRKFITNISWNTGFEKWFTLHRNKKYRNLQVDWSSTFKILNENKSSEYTNLIFSKRKADKLKLMIEELPTVEHMKLRRLDLYDDWLCPVCNIEKETFNHVWLCSKHIRTLTLMTIPLKQELNNIIRQYTNTTLPNQFYEDENIWDVIISDDSFTFIDLIKGIIPTSLTTYIKSFVKTHSLTLYVLDKFFFILQGLVRDLI